MQIKHKTITGGLYLVADPAQELKVLLPKVIQCIEGGVNIIQLWNHWLPDQNKKEYINSICKIAHIYDVPVLINEQWQLFTNTRANGIHFDAPPDDFDNIRKIIARPFITGITCGNDMHRVNWAIDNDIDYISFCSLFPSASAGSCELVQPETIRKVRSMTAMPIFASGGITPDKLESLQDLGLDGIAVISGIMNADDPQAKAEQYKKALLKLKKLNA